MDPFKIIAADSLEPRPFPEQMQIVQKLMHIYAENNFHGRKDDLNQAMKYGLQGGKCLRGFLAIESARMHGIGAQVSTQVGFAVECIHAYSLIHDDLPCMDDDDLRRGQPTVHRKWTEAVAVLAGDALQALAFELLSHEAVGTADVRVALMASLAFASGRDGMVGGQMLDIAAETAESPLTLDEIITLQSGKTGALITWSATAGARLASADPAPLARYGDALGLAFQIWDDVLDVEGDEAETGKALRKDAEAGKATFVSAMGLSAAKRRCEELVEEASEAISLYGDEARALREAARFVISRTK